LRAGWAAWAVVGLCAAGALTAAGCAPDGADPSADAPGMTPAARREAHPSTPGAAQLKAALLAPSDMGSAFAAQPPPTSGHTPVSGCAQLDILLSVGVSLGPGDQGVTYQATDFGPTVGESLMTAPAGTTVAAVYAEDRAALASCRNLKITAESGVTFEVALTPATLGSPKTPSTAVRMDGTLEGVQIDGYLVLDDVGPAELAYLYVQIADGSAQLASRYFERADARAREQFAAG
jgi:hypothetical protein